MRGDESWIKKHGIKLLQQFDKWTVALSAKLFPDLAPTMAQFIATEKELSSAEGATHNPIFEDISSGNYHLFDQSVAIDYCPPIIGLEIDIDGTSRDITPDAGAREYLP